MRRLVTDTLIIAERNLVRLPRAPDLLLAFTVQPIMFVLLFRYVFGGAINTHGLPYADFLIPGIIVQNIAFGGFVTALGLNEDVHKGLIDRFRSLPMARPAVLAGRTLADVVTNLLSIVVLLITGLIIGFSFHAGVVNVIAGFGLLILFGYAFSWVFALRRSARLLAGGGQLGRLHRRLPAHLHLLRVRPRPVDARGPACVRQRQPVHDHRGRDALPVARRSRRQHVWGAVVWARGDLRRVRAARGRALPPGCRPLTASEAR